MMNKQIEASGCPDQGYLVNRTGYREAPALISPSAVEASMFYYTLTFRTIVVISCTPYSLLRHSRYQPVVN
jgi:hypothetical protein